MQNHVLEHLKSLNADRDKLMEKLERSLAIQEVYPEAFEHGTVKSYWHGNPWPPNKLKFKIVRGDGSHKEFTAEKLPKILADTCPVKFRYGRPIFP